MNKDVAAEESIKQVEELCENIEVVGPGLMLSEARKKLSLSIEEVSSRLNFRTNLVKEIEQDIFDTSLPATFNRGYLRNYAKLVAIDVDEVLSAYDMLSIAEVQRSEMQSFSNLTEKQAEHSRLMWFSYLIVALLFGLMVLWWLQEPKLPVNFFDKTEQEQVISHSDNNAIDESSGSSTATLTKMDKAEEIKKSEVAEVIKSEQETPELFIDEVSPDTIEEQIVEPKVEDVIDTDLALKESTAVFTFLGDCWVNIYDATGERVAWGVKKSGYVMTVAGKAPLKVTLGKPELATIAFNGNEVDMSSFNTGNIAKFTLPLTAP